MTIYEPQNDSFSKETHKEDKEKMSLAVERALKAAKEIQELCNYGDCDNCPFVDSDYACKLKENFPYQWGFLIEG